MKTITVGGEINHYNAFPYILLKIYIMSYNYLPKQLYYVKLISVELKNKSNNNSNSPLYNLPKSFIGPIILTSQTRNPDDWTSLYRKRKMKLRD